MDNDFFSYQQAFQTALKGLVSCYAAPWWLLIIFSTYFFLSRFTVWDFKDQIKFNETEIDNLRKLLESSRNSSIVKGRTVVSKPAIIIKDLIINKPINSPDTAHPSVTGASEESVQIRM